MDKPPYAQLVIDAKDSFLDIVKMPVLEFEILRPFSQNDLDKKGTVINCVVQSNHSMET